MTSQQFGDLLLAEHQRNRAARSKQKYYKIPSRWSSFEARLEQSFIPEPNTGCWLWVGSVAGLYGRINDGVKCVAAHRASYERFKGQIPTGLFLDHLCRVTLCVNPDHLEPVTAVENMRRGRAARYGCSVEFLNNHCKHGHEFDGVNNWRLSRGRCWRCSILASAKNRSIEANINANRISVARYTLRTRGEGNRARYERLKKSGGVL
jgi:HNH endonuclease